MFTDKWLEIQFSESRFEYLILLYFREMKKLSALALLFLMGSFVKGQQYGHYTLYSVQNSNTTQLIDTNGTVFKTWTHAGNAKTGYSSYLMPGGTLWRSVMNTGNVLMGGGMTGRIQKVAWDGTVLWDFTYSSSNYCLHHDFCPMPNGNVLLISYDVKTAAQATQAGASQSISVWSEKIIEVQPTGTSTGQVVWEWKVWDHLVQNINPAKDNYKSSIVEHPELLNINYNLTKDWIHMNGIDYNPILDQISFSSHYLNQWFIIDHSTSSAEAASHSGGNAGKGGDFLYRYGNPASYGASGSTVLNVTHDAHWIPEGIPNEGRLVGFNNKGVSNNKSSVDQIDIPQDGFNYFHTSGQAYQPTIYTQRHACNGYSSNMGNSQQLPNGNMLICVATSGLMYEINPAGEILWSKTATGTVPQAFRYTACYVTNAAPPIPTITSEGNKLISSSAASYQWYFNGQKILGANADTCVAGQPGVYLVRTTDATGCEAVYSYSAGYRVITTAPLSLMVTSNLSTICQGDTVKLQAQTTGGTGANTFLWSSDPIGFVSNSASPVVSPTLSTAYKVVVKSGVEKDSGTISITVNPLPSTPSISQNGNELMSSLGASYIWYYNGVFQPGLTGQTVSPTFNGNYQVQIVDLNGCKSSLSLGLDFVYASAIKSEKREIRVYPNPTSGIVYIRGTFGGELSQVSVFDAIGQLQFFTDTNNTLDLSCFPPGLYRVVIYNQGQYFIQKLNLIR